MPVTHLAAAEETGKQTLERLEQISNALEARLR